MILSSLITLVIAKHYLIPKFKVIDINQVIKDDGKMKNQFLNNKISKDDYRKYYQQKLDIVSKSINKIVVNDNAIIFVKSAIIDNNSLVIDDITNDVGQYVKANTIYIKK
jgi:hypothetical protein